MTVEEWVNTLNAIKNDLIKTSIKDNVDNWFELTKPSVGDYDCYTENTIKTIDYENETYMVEDDDEEYNINYAEIEHKSFLPMYKTMWTFNNSYEENWVREHLYEVSDMGFRIYEYQETGTLYIGIDGTGYNFYKEHWNKLYAVLYKNN